MSAGLKGSQILRLATQVNERIAAGDRVFNFTIGDFDPEVFPIPEAFEAELHRAYREKKTNYPPSGGLPEVREAVAEWSRERLGLPHGAEDIVISAGARPMVFAVVNALVDPGDVFLYPVPSWNNNYYAHLGRARPIEVPTRAEHHFLPTADALRPHIRHARILSLCSPLNPSGTAFGADALSEICDMVLEENERRGSKERPLYVIYDQIYWPLTYGRTRHLHPVGLRPAMRDYTLYIDGMSKAFAATGVRVGWGIGPSDVMKAVRSVISHMGAWSPKPEQVACARFLTQRDVVDAWLIGFKAELSDRLDRFHAGIAAMRARGLPIEAIPPEAAIYLTLRFDVIGRTSGAGRLLRTADDIFQWLLEEAGLGLVPFHAFGASGSDQWFRLSVGTCSGERVDAALGALEGVLTALR